MPDFLAAAVLFPSLPACCYHFSTSVHLRGTVCTPLSVQNKRRVWCDITIQGISEFHSRQVNCTGVCLSAHRHFTSVYKSLWGRAVREKGSSLSYLGNNKKASFLLGNAFWLLPSDCDIWQLWSVQTQYHWWTSRCTITVLLVHRVCRKLLIYLITTVLQFL